MTARPSGILLATASLALPVTAIAMVLACSSEPSASPSSEQPAEAGTDTGATSPSDRSSSTPDASPHGDASVPIADESEPNDAVDDSSVPNPMKVPGQMNASIDPANDRDLFSFNVAPGELWQWTITPTSNSLAPHLALFDNAPDNLNPARVVRGPAGKSAVLEQFILHPGSFIAAVRDERNVLADGGVGGPGFKYSLVAVKKAIAAIPVTFPSTKSGRLASRGALDFYSFTGVKGTTFGIRVMAQRKTPPSSLNSRLSLFHVTGNEGIRTNDNVGDVKDSQLEGEIPADGNYLVIIEHEGEDAADLSYDIEFSTTQFP